MEANNMKAMREAIVKSVNLITEFGNAEILKSPLEVIVDIEAILKSALAEPPRNCVMGHVVDARSPVACGKPHAFATRLRDAAGDRAQRMENVIEA